MKSTLTRDLKKGLIKVQKEKIKIIMAKDKCEKEIELREKKSEQLTDELLDLYIQKKKIADEIEKIRAKYQTPTEKENFKPTSIFKGFYDPSKENHESENKRISVLCPT